MDDRAGDGGAVIHCAAGVGVGGMITGVPGPLRVGRLVTFCGGVGVTEPAGLASTPRSFKSTESLILKVPEDCNA